MQVSDVCFIRAKGKKDYIFEAIEAAGFKTIIPYRDRNLLLRILREIWFKLNLPFRRIWINPEIDEAECKVFVALDPLLIPEIFERVHARHPLSTVILQYENRADKAINPESVPSYVKKWTYDPDDSLNYGMTLIHPYYFPMYRTVKSEDEKNCDILFLGRDKGRLQTLLNLKSRFEKMGLRTIFHICADREYLTPFNKEYKPLLPYTDYLDLLGKSKAILNVARKDQKAITQRELECVFHKVKCITTNSWIKDFELYAPGRFLVLNDDTKDEEIREFLKRPFEPTDDEKLKEYDYSKIVMDLINRG